jgi:hypothetical protein
MSVKDHAMLLAAQDWATLLSDRLDDDEFREFAGFIDEDEYDLSAFVNQINKSRHPEDYASGEEPRRLFPMIDDTSTAPESEVRETEIRITMTPKLFACLEHLARRGRYGRTPAEVAAELLRTKLRELALDLLLDLPLR